MVSRLQPYRNPTLAKYARVGHPPKPEKLKAHDIGSIVSRPCTERKSGAPTFCFVLTIERPGHPPQDHSLSHSAHVPCLTKNTRRPRSGCTCIWPHSFALTNPVLRIVSIG
jgi:hypothetical protein